MNWLGRQDSNLGMSIPKTDALPLGDAPPRPRVIQRNFAERNADEPKKATKKRRIGRRPALHSKGQTGPATSALNSAREGLRKFIARLACAPLRQSIYQRLHRSVAQPGRALSSGGRGRRFESSLPDHFIKAAVNFGSKIAHCSNFCSD